MHEQASIHTSEVLTAAQPAVEDFLAYCRSRGITADEHLRRSQTQSDIIPILDFDDVRQLEVRESEIAGMGVFTKTGRAADDRIVLMLGSDLARTPAARWINHSPTPNTEIRAHAGEWHLFAVRDISRGEEFVIDYRHTPWRDNG